jgi:RsiW-degrading membrane proteinase PrsW (M82 family)
MITSMGGLFYGSFVMWYGRISLGNGLALFFTGIIVITCIFLPFNWSIQNSDSGKEVSLFFFNLNIEGNNFINDLKNFLTTLNIPQKYTQSSITFFLAFLEECAKLTLLILCIRKSLRMPVIIVYMIVVWSLLHRLIGAENSNIVVWATAVISFIGLIILWWLLGKHIRTESVADYMYSVALVALGFAFAENIKYIYDLSNAGNSQDAIVHNAILRAIFGYLSHTFFSMVCVALYARGRFAFLRLIDNSGNLSLGQKALGWKWYTRLKSIQGFWMGVIAATIIHAVYNILISENVLIPSVILIIGFLFLELFVLHDLRNNTKYGHIENYMQ